MGSWFSRPADVDLADAAFWALSEEERGAAFALLRREAPVAWQEERATPWSPAGRGYWAITRHADICAISRDQEAFTSGLGTEIVDLPLEVTRLYGGMLNMAGAEHLRLRRIVSSAFTPRVLARAEDDIRTRARRIVAAVAPRGECDFLADVAAILPAEVICDMLGVPAADRAEMQRLTMLTLGFGDPAVGTMDDSLAAARRLVDYGAALGRQRRETPQDDLVTALVQARIEGDRLSDDEVGSFFELLVTAGIETTASTIAHGMLQLARNPDQCDRWRADFDAVAPRAVEEIIRVATPVVSFRRTATRDVELHGTRIRAGDKVVLWYNSANRDETVFEEPWRFDVDRHPNDHVAFGGGGPHFCLGAHLARREIALIFRELLHRLPDIEFREEPERMSTVFLNGFHRMPCSFTPA